MDCPNHIWRTKSSIKKRIIVRRSVRSMFGEQTFAQLRTGFKSALAPANRRQTATTATHPNPWHQCQSPGCYTATCATKTERETAVWWAGSTPCSTTQKCFSPTAKMAPCTAQARTPEMQDSLRGPFCIGHVRHVIVCVCVLSLIHI